MAGIASKINGKKGGRPKGSIAKSTKEAIELKNMYVELARERGLPIAEALIEKALTGDVSAIKEFNDRAFGKASQPMEIKATVEVGADETIKKLTEQLNEFYRGAGITSNGGTTSPMGSQTQG
jgi:hypothetical protein